MDKSLISRLKSIISSVSSSYADQEGTVAQSKGSSVLLGRGTILLVVLGIGSYFFFSKYRIEGLEHLKVVSRSATPSPEAGIPPDPKDKQGGKGKLAKPETLKATEQDVIRIASFNVQLLGQKKLQNKAVVNMIADIMHYFDVVAIQEIRSTDQDVLPNMIKAINHDGLIYDYIASDRVGLSSNEQYAFIYNTARVVPDPQTAYVLRDDNDLLHREPFVARFQTLGIDQGDPFTFTLINIHVNPQLAAAELNVLDDVYRVVASDGRKEDDIIILGDFNSSPSGYGDLAMLPDIEWVISGVATNTQGDKESDNILLTNTKTIEYSGRGGVFDVERAFDLTKQEVLEISEHLPIWAEFSARENVRIELTASDDPTTKPR